MQDNPSLFLWDAIFSTCDTGRNLMNALGIEHDL